MKTLAIEVGHAAAALENELPVRHQPHGGTRHADVLVQTARHIERLQAKGRKLRRELKVVEAEIRTEKKALRALCAEIGRGK